MPAEPPDAPPFDVVVVGLGPVGAALTALLGGRGLRVLALEKEAAPYGLPRAAHLDGHALRALRAAGVEAEGRGLDGFDLVDRQGRLLLRGRPKERPPDGFPAGLLVHQPTVEAALRARLEALPPVEVRLGWAVERVEEAPDRVRLEGLDAGRPAHVEAAWCVGCDGARSLVREAVGARLGGSGFEQDWLVVDVLLRRPVALPDRLLQIADPARPTTYVPFADPRRRWEFKLARGETAADALRPERVRERLARHVGLEAVTVERAAVYTFHDLVADRWRRGRLVLAGDAAHQTPPFLGQGLGAGLRDVWAVAPLLEAVVRGGPSSGLDAYERERRPHVEAQIRQAVRLGRLVTLPEPWASMRDRALRAAHRVGPLRRLLLDVRG